MDGSVVATALQCVAVWALFQGWKASTEVSATFPPSLTSHKKADHETLLSQERWEDDVPFLKSFDSSKNFYDDY